MGLGQYDSLGEYCGPHTASSGFLILLPFSLPECSSIEVLHITSCLTKPFPLPFCSSPFFTYPALFSPPILLPYLFGCLFHSMRDTIRRYFPVTPALHLPYHCISLLISLCSCLLSRFSYIYFLSLYLVYMYCSLCIPLFPTRIIK